MTLIHIKLIATYLLPFITAFVGWLTNYLAIKMLFHPYQSVRILFVRIQGILPKRKMALARSLSEIVATELISVKDLETQLEQDDIKDYLLGTINHRLDTLIHEKLQQEMPLISMFLNDDIKSKIKDLLMHEVENAYPDLYHAFLDGMKQKLDIKELVYEKIVTFSMQKIEVLLMSVMKKEFKFIEFIGAILGFVIGLLQLGLFLSFKA